MFFKSEGEEEREAPGSYQPKCGIYYRAITEGSRGDCSEGPGCSLGRWVNPQLQLLVAAKGREGGGRRRGRWPERKTEWGRGGAREADKRSIKTPPSLPAGETEAALSPSRPQGSASLPSGAPPRVRLQCLRWGWPWPFPGGARLTLSSLGLFHVSLAGGWQGRLWEHRRPPPLHPGRKQPSTGCRLTGPRRGDHHRAGGLSLLVSSHCFPQMRGGGHGFPGMVQRTRSEECTV